jgi:Phage shock protein B
MLDLFQTIFNPKVIAIIAVFSIPVSAIWATYKYKIEQLRLKKGAESLNNEELALLKSTLAHNKQLEERVRNLETIITSLDSSTSTQWFKS